MAVEISGLQKIMCRIPAPSSQLLSPQPQTPRPQPPTPTLRLGFRYVRGLREESAKAIVRERAKRPFTDIDDLHNRVPELRKDELRTLAEVGALNFIKGSSSENRDSRAAIGNSKFA